MIAQVHGVATAAGCQVGGQSRSGRRMRGCHVCHARVKIGLILQYPRRRSCPAPIAPKKAMEMLLTGMPVKATEAERIGLVIRCSLLIHWDEETMRLAKQIADAMLTRYHWERRHSISSSRLNTPRHTKSLRKPWLKMPSLPMPRKA